MSLLEEFKTFAMRGHVVDMAVGVVVGAAFGKVVSAMVEDLIMPPIGLAAGGMDFSDLAWTMKAAAGDKPPVVLKYGHFLQTLLDFMIIAAAIFGFVKLVNRLRTPAKPNELSPLTVDQTLLAEIRDLLRSRAAGADPVPPKPPSE